MSDRTSGKVVEPVATEMVCRVAAAIALAEKTNPAWRANPDSWIEWVDTARAAIEAMREPTILMVESASHLVEGDTATYARVLPERLFLLRRRVKPIAKAAVHARILAPRMLEASV